MTECNIISSVAFHFRSLRLFFSDETKTSGQLIIASLESQYKIFHFHHGGLDKLVETFQEWNLFAASADAGRAVNDLRHDYDSRSCQTAWLFVCLPSLIFPVAIGNVTAQWYRTAMHRDVCTRSLARPFAFLLAPLFRLLTHSRAQKS